MIYAEIVLYSTALLLLRDILRDTDLWAELSEWDWPLILVWIATGALGVTCLTWIWWGVF